MPILMITISTENLNLISQDFYNDIISSLDLTLVPCTCGHVGNLIRHGSYKRRFQLSDQILTITIVRVFCTACGHTHALLLSSMVPYSQIPFQTQVEAVQALVHHQNLSSFLEEHCFIDECNIRYIFRNYIRYWHQRLLSCSISISSFPMLIQHCFFFFSRQFMQIKCTRNLLFQPPT